MSSNGLALRLVLEKGKDFDYIQEWHEETKDIAELFGKKFKHVGEIREKISGIRYYIPEQKIVDFQEVPFTVREWPVYYRVSNSDCHCKLEVAKIEAIME